MKNKKDILKSTIIIVVLAIISIGIGVFIANHISAKQEKTKRELANRLSQEYLRK